MKKTITLSVLALAILATPLSAQITREQADAIVLEHIERTSEWIFDLYVNVAEPSADGFTITTAKGEIVRARYATWVYFLREHSGLNTPPDQRRYFFVRESNGSLVEIITNNDPITDNLASWILVEQPSNLLCREINNRPILFPNPVTDFLIVPCFGKQVLVEIFDLNGNRVFSNLLSGESRLDLSFLTSGVYVVNIAGETYRIIKN